MTNRLTIKDVVSALDYFPRPRYDSIDVFADDVEELVQWAKDCVGPADLANEGGFLVDGETYELQVHAKQGAARVLLHSASNQGNPVLRAPTTEDVRTAVQVSEHKTRDLVGRDLVFGVLQGDPINDRTNAPRRVFTLAFDRRSGSWQTYDGGLVRWMKDELGRLSA